MKKRLLGLLILSGLFLFTGIVQAQRLKRGGPSMQEVTEVRMLDSQNPGDTAIIQVFEAVAPERPSSPRTPRFAIIGKDNKYYFGIGGYIKGTASMDFGTPINNPTSFITSEIIKAGDGNGALYQMSAQTSNLFLNFISMPGSKHQLGAYINFNLIDDLNYGFNLVHAYLTYAGFKIGYDYTMFADLTAIPNTIDWEGPPSLATVGNTLMNYTWHRDNWSFAVGAEMPMVGQSSNAAYKVRTVYQRIPAIPMYIQYRWDKKSHIRFSALWRNVQYRNIEKDKNENKMGWGVQLTSKAALTHKLDLYGQALYGKGISNFIQDLSDLYIDLVPSSVGKYKDVELWGGFLGLAYQFTDKMCGNIMFSQLRTYSDYDGAADNYKYAQYALANLFYNLTPQVRVGAEYIWGRRANYGEGSNNNNRIQLCMQFNF